MDANRMKLGPEGRAPCLSCPANLSPLLKARKGNVDGRGTPPPYPSALSVYTAVRSPRTCPEWSSCFGLGDAESNSTHHYAGPHPVSLRSLPLPLRPGREHGAGPSLMLPWCVVLGTSVSHLSFLVQSLCGPPHLGANLPLQALVNCPVTALSS